MPDGTTEQIADLSQYSHTDPGAERHALHARGHPSIVSLNPTSGNPEVNPIATASQVTPPLPFPSKKISKDAVDSKYNKFMKVLKGLNINIPFTDALTEMPAYAKFLKDILIKKSSILELVDKYNDMPYSNQCSALNKNNLPMKLNESGRFAITIALGSHRYKTFCDLGVGTSLLPLSI